MVTKYFEIGLGKGTGLALAWVLNPRLTGEESGKIIEGLVKGVYKPRENMLSKS
jgi:hypothetical protein